ncbi:hypothetical protein COV06_02880 [Candidatus Uhrbacteria bacterium CG10_big_fil_rev_8_21_14_0_10_50_16]|uniref:Uncharacterized protein n=1 Tax=Candidatus Uhrbacteria bacterium CG10_big_fil_rev_8_21_14_0_10_50_16 TaxID=1975039 RepID=A0A2H0RM27_9BACT|nr:MAG: hypothetical protein COV06_02880 [Candidatus Uhrbacteria bacterium CG10_big_fil_rev_8_21_14_0_10_50_16]
MLHPESGNVNLELESESTEKLHARYRALMREQDASTNAMMRDQGFDPKVRDRDVQIREEHEHVRALLEARGMTPEQMQED